jgi:hypothetical protein
MDWSSRFVLGGRSLREHLYHERSQASAKVIYRCQGESICFFGRTSPIRKGRRPIEYDSSGTSDLAHYPGTRLECLPEAGTIEGDRRTVHSTTRDTHSSVRASGHNVTLSKICMRF